MATTARQIHHAPHPCPLMDQSIFEAYCDDIAPDLLSLPNEQTHSKSIDSFTKGNELTIRAELPGVDPHKDIEVRFGAGILELKVMLHPVERKMKKVKVN